MPVIDASQGVHRRQCMHEHVQHCVTLRPMHFWAARKNKIGGGSGLEHWKKRIAFDPNMEHESTCPEARLVTVEIQG